MKKMLSALGVVALSSSAIVGATSYYTTSTNQTVDHQRPINLDEVNSLKEAYEVLSLEQQVEVSNEMEVISQLQPDQIATFLETSKSEFLKTHQVEIIQMSELYQEVKDLQQSVEVNQFASVNIPWSAINDLIKLDLVDSNDYQPWVSNYGPSAWWKFWEWGWQINFPAGDINIMKLVRLGFNYFNGINFKKLETLINSIKPFFNYISNLEAHKTDKIQVLYDLVINTAQILKDSKLPFTPNVFAIFDQFAESIPPLVRIFPLSFGLKIISEQVEKYAGMSLSEISTTYISKFNFFASMLPMVNKVITLLIATLPTVSIGKWLLLPSLNALASSMIGADKNHRGVTFRFYHYIIPLGFYAR